MRCAMLSHHCHLFVDGYFFPCSSFICLFVRLQNIHTVLCRKNILLLCVACAGRMWIRLFSNFVLHLVCVTHRNVIKHFTHARVVFAAVVVVVVVFVVVVRRRRSSTLMTTVPIATYARCHRSIVYESIRNTRQRRRRRYINCELFEIKNRAAQRRMSRGGRNGAAKREHTS